MLGRCLYHNETMIVMIISLKIIDVIVSIFPFATTTSFESSSSFTVDCTLSTNKHADVTYGYSYPFDLNSVGFHIPVCNTSAAQKIFVNLGDSEASTARFFVSVSVSAFLYSLASLILYIFFDDFYRKNAKTVVIDLVISVVQTMLWLISSSAWATSVSNIKFYTDPAESGVFQNLVPACQTESCQVVSLGNFVSLNSSVIFGFLNFVVWGGNLWCLYKETPWYKIRSKPPPEPGILSEIDPQRV